MNAFSALCGLNDPVWQALVDALMHTLWQGALAAGSLCLALRLVPVARVNLRYGLSAAPLTLITLLCLGAWVLLDTPGHPATNPP